MALNSLQKMAIDEVFSYNFNCIEDSSQHWDDVKKNLDRLTSDQRVQVVDGALKDISNVNRRSRLISLLTEPEKIALTATAVKPTAWQAIRDTTKLTHGNSSEDLKDNYRTRLANKKGVENARAFDK